MPPATRSTGTTSSGISRRDRPVLQSAHGHQDQRRGSAASFLPIRGTGSAGRSRQLPAERWCSRVLAAMRGPVRRGSWCRCKCSPNPSAGRAVFPARLGGRRWLAGLRGPRFARLPGCAEPLLGSWPARPCGRRRCPRGPCGAGRSPESALFSSTRPSVAPAT